MILTYMARYGIIFNIICAKLAVVIGQTFILVFLKIDLLLIITISIYD